MGGLNVGFTNGTWTGWRAQDYNGQDTNQDWIEGTWQYRTTLLYDYVGLTANSISLLKDYFNPVGSWSIYIDIAIVSMDGTVTHVYGGESESLSPQGVNPLMIRAFGSCGDCANRIRPNGDERFYNEYHEVLSKRSSRDSTDGVRIWWLAGLEGRVRPLRPGTR